MRVQVTNVFWGVLSVVLSWTVNKSILWAMFHFFCGGFYAIYWLIVYTGLMDSIKEMCLR
jgi:hypothetical protein